jgi:hypothetical protein
MYSSSNLRVVSLEKTITASASRLPADPFCGVGTDEVEFECTVNPDKGPVVTLTSTAPFTYFMGQS